MHILALQLEVESLLITCLEGIDDSARYDGRTAHRADGTDCLARVGLNPIMIIISNCSRGKEEERFLKSGLLK